ncbi:MAG: hypothetical protein RIB47_05005 [Cyclobacteriaceae bacterium]
MRSTEEITIVNVPNSERSEIIRQDAIAFWKKHKVLIKEEVLQKRASELLLLAYDDKQNVIAASTFEKVKLKLLDNNFLYQYRCFIDPNFRVIGFDYHLTQKSLDTLEAMAQKEEVKPIGVVTVIENPNLYNNKVNNAAVWRAYKMYFIGFNTKGQPIRVYYFKDAVI